MQEIVNEINQLDPLYLETCRSFLSKEQAKSLSETNHWEHVNRPQVHADWDALYKEFSALIDSSIASDRKIQDFIEQHYAISRRFYTPSKEAYIGMALFYNEDSSMRDFHNAYHPKMVEFLGNAMVIYAQEKL